MMDRIYLLNSWPFLVKHIQGIITELRTKAMKVYEMEVTKSPAHNQHLTHGRHMNIRSMTPSKPARSLVELMGDKHIFRKLHQTFTWLLKAGGNRLTEKLLEGPPTEDSIIDIEKQEGT
jgi:folliculin